MAQQSQQGIRPGGDGGLTTELGERAEMLFKRVREIEQTLAAREWWLLGRELPEARLLSEVSSLLAVARGELETVLAESFGRTIPRSESTDQYPVLMEDNHGAHDAAWLAAIRGQAIDLLRMISGSLPPMMQYAQMLRQYAERFNLDASIVDAFRIVADRLHEVSEAMRQPPG